MRDLRLLGLVAALIGAALMATAPRRPSGLRVALWTLLILGGSAAMVVEWFR